MSAIPPVKRGEIWMVAGGSDVTGKPRPAVIIQDDRFGTVDTVTICSFTTRLIDAPLFRLPVDPGETSGLAVLSHVMVDKITTVPRTRLGRRIGKLSDADRVRLDREVFVFLGLAG